MKDGFIKVGAVAPKIRVADVFGNCDECIKEAARAEKSGVKLLVFPELALTGATCGDLFMQRTLLREAEAALRRFAEQTKELDMVSFIGLPVQHRGNVYNGVAAVFGGSVMGIVAKSVLTPEEKRYFTAADEGEEINFAGQECFFGTKALFYPECAPQLTAAVCVGSEMLEPFSPCRYHAVHGATLIVNPTSAPEAVGRGELEDIKLRAESHSLCCAIISAAAGVGESGTDGIYSGASKIAECGNIIAASEPFARDTLTVAECDFDKLVSERLRRPGFEAEDRSEYADIVFELDMSDTELTRKIDKSPFIPENKSELDARCELIFDIQANALARRIERSYSKGAVIGVSGGLDSTLALLVAVRAVDILGLDRSAVTAVTMPCFGTTERTKGNAERLSEALGASLKCIDIKAAVTQHFEDIGQDSRDFNVVYENAQARERTQVLMDVANACGGLVVGTGDLSELALGWATYNGDHMSMYGVNAAVPKTLMRHMVSYSADCYERDGATEAAAILRDVLATPISPELLPPEDGEIAQRTEGIVGPYELHDFFLYYTVRYGFAPRKILRMAAHAFEGVYDSEFIKGWLKVFIKRFFAQQFKRSCLPDGPAVGSVSLSPRVGFKMPSDAVAAMWLGELEENNE